MFIRETVRENAVNEGHPDSQQFISLWRRSGRSCGFLDMDDAGGEIFVRRGQLEWIAVTPREMDQSTIHQIYLLSSATMPSSCDRERQTVE